MAGRFEVVRALARGGMADVYEAVDTETHSRVALKVLREERSKEPEVLLRFEREGHAAGAIRDPNVALVFDCGVTEKNRPFLVMELLDGHDLARELDLRGGLPAAEAVQIIVEACQGMIAAHEAGIVHRDLKPSNLFLAQQGGRRVVKVLDFGISKFVAAAGEHVTLTKALFGSPLYRSPEQFRSAKAADRRSDVWALGVIFYEILTGLPPFVAQNAPAVGLAITREPHVPPTQRRPSLPKGVDAVVAGALHKKPADRYQSMQEFLRALEDLLPRGRDDTPTRLDALSSARPRAPVPDAPPTRIERIDDDPPTHVDLSRELAPLSAPPPPVVRSSAPPAPSLHSSAPPPGASPFAFSDPTTTRGIEPSSSSLPPAAAPRRKDARVLWAGLFAVLVIGLGVFFALRSPPPRPAAGTSSPAAAPPPPSSASALASSQSAVPAPSAEPDVPAAAPSATEVDSLPPAGSSSAPTKSSKPRGKPRDKGLYMPRDI